MVDPNPWTDATRPLDEVARHDALCDRFEEAIDAGRSLTIGDLLGEVQEAERPALFIALVRVAWDRLNPPPSDAELKDLFPEYADLLASAAAARRSRESLPTLPGYEVRQRLGEGGMGVVYLARQVALDRPVAVKMIRSGAGCSTAEAMRFGRESRAASKMSHPRVVRVLDAGSHQGQSFCVMEYVPGGTLSQRIAGKPVDPGWAADLLAGVADGVQYVHSQGIVHRDLKPSNVLLDADDQPLVADFGLARLMDDESSGLTRTRAVLGTAGYMAPELARGGGRGAGPAVDIYALGAVLFEMLTGRPPFRESTFEETLERAKNDDPPRPSDLANGVPPDLEAICLKCLEKDPARRYSTAGELAVDLRRWRAGESVTARPMTDYEMAARWGHRVGYDLTSELACTRWAYTYAAVQRSTRRNVVLVACNTRSGEQAAVALRRQADVLAGLTHTNVVRLFDYVPNPPVPYLVLEYADGTPLVRPLHPDVAANIASQIAAGLDAVHDRKVLHLGVCPSAIGVTPDGIPRLGGFGSARPVGSSLADLVPQSGGLGRANYTAPEVLARRADAVGYTADVFGLGATLYELLSGRPPFNAPGLAAVREWVLTRPPDPLPPHVPEPLARLCLDCLALDPARRPQRALDVTARLGMMALSEDSTVSLEASPRTTIGASFRVLIDRGPTDAGRTARFQQRRVTVGREDGRDLLLRSDTVSKHHFTIHWDDEAATFLLTDNASKNGVWVNGRRVIGSRPLAPGDNITVSAYVLVFQPD